MSSPRAIAAAAKRIRDLQRDGAGLATVLSAEQRNEVVATFITLIEGLYAHLPRKHATYGHDPVQRLRSLRQRLDAIGEDEFHRSIAEIFTDLRDAHTRYIGPFRLHGQVAFLPILVERYTEEGREHYVVSKIFAVNDDEKIRFEEMGFDEGVEVTHWNGAPIDRAVERHADRETGGRSDARKARALESLTLRPLRYALPPDEDWIVISFKTAGGQPGEVRLGWRIVRAGDVPQPPEAEGMAQLAYAGDPAAEAVRRVKKMLFSTDKWYEADRQRLPALAQSVAAQKSQGNWFTGKYQDAVAARELDLPAGRFGLLRLWSFDLRDDDGFIAEVIDLLEELPRRGLIIDLRGNPGGLIWAAERLLQLFTPNPIEPTRFSILATDLTRTMAAARLHQRLAPWRRSLDSAVLNGEFYSRSVPLTPPERCNNVGQVYPGPVVAVVDANTYSAGDLFAAGWVDNRIGALVSVDKATGGGGANVWYPNHVSEALLGTPVALKPLPEGISYTMAFRRAVRVGDVAGTGIEDLGVPGHLRRSLTKRDLTERNADLLDFCSRLLASETFTDLKTRIARDLLEIETTNLDRVDLYVDGHPQRSLTTGSGSGTRTLTHEFQGPWYQAEVIGYTGDVHRQRRLLRPAGV